GNPMRGDRRTGAQQLFGDDISVEVPQTLAAVIHRNRKAEESGVPQTCGKLLVPACQPRIYLWLPAEFGAIGCQKLTDRCTQLRQLGLVGAECVKRAHRGVLPLAVAAATWNQGSSLQLASVKSIQLYSLLWQCFLPVRDRGRAWLACPRAGNS